MQNSWHTSLGMDSLSGQCNIVFGIWNNYAIAIIRVTGIITISL